MTSISDIVIFYAAALNDKLNNASTALYVLNRVWIACSERAVLEHWIYAKVPLVRASADASLVGTVMQSLAVMVKN